MLNEIIGLDAGMVGAGIVALAQKAKDKIFGPSEKTSSPSSSKESTPADSKNPKSNTSDSKNIWVNFESNFLPTLTDPKQVLKYIFLKYTKLTSGFQIQGATDEKIFGIYSNSKDIILKSHQLAQNAFVQTVPKTSDKFKTYLDSFFTDTLKLQTDSINIINEIDIQSYVKV